MARSIESDLLIVVSDSTIRSFFVGALTHTHTETLVVVFALSRRNKRLLNERLCACVRLGSALSVCSLFRSSSLSSLANSLARSLQLHSRQLQRQSAAPIHLRAGYYCLALTAVVAVAVVAVVVVVAAAAVVARSVQPVRLNAR